MTPSPSPWTETLPRRESITAEEFRPLLQKAAACLLQVGNGTLESAPEEWPQRRIYLLSRFGDDLETWLDDYGARENKEFHVFRELTAMIRWLALAMGGLVHLDARRAQYVLPDPGWAAEVLAPEVRKSAILLGGMIQACFGAFREAWEERGLAWPSGRLEEDSVEEVRSRKRLPRDLIETGEEAALGAPADSPAAARLAARYAATLEYLASLGRERREDLESLRQFMASRCTEENARTHEARVHNLQSYYDSLVAGSSEEREHPELKSLRGSISVALHLLESVTALSHLYERHDVYERHGATKGLFERLIDERALLDVSVNVCLVLTYKSVQKGAPIAARLLDVLLDQATVELPLPEGLNLHARPLSLIATVVNQHGTPVEAEIAGTSCNAASIMQLLVLVGSHPTAQAIRFKGDLSVLNDLSTLFSSRLGEDGLDKLPATLDYLKP